MRVHHTNLKEDILKSTNNGYEIFNRYLGQKYPGGKVKKGLSIRNPFREDKHPSFNVYQNDKRIWCCKDFGNNEYDFDCFGFYQWYEKLPDFPSTLKALNREFGLGLVHEPVKASKNGKSSVGSVQKKKLWGNSDLAYWQQYGITKNTLDHFSVFALKSFEVSSSRGNSFIINSTTDNPIFAYQVGRNNYKIYQPLTKAKKNKFSWIGGKPKGFVFGWDQLPTNGKYVFITAGEKDVMSLYAQGFSAISLNSETANLPQNILLELEDRFEKVIVLYDIDNTGIKSSKKLSQKYGLLTLDLPSSLQTLANGKDISDYFKASLDPAFVKEFSVEIFKGLIDDLPKPNSSQKIIKLSTTKYALDIWLFEIKRKVSNGVVVNEKLTFKGIYRDGIITLLTSNGYYKKYQQDQSYLFILEKDNIIEEVNLILIKDFLDEYIRKINAPLQVHVDQLSVTVLPDMLIETFLRQSNLYCNDSFLEHLTNHEKPILKDDSENCYLPFQESIVAINKEGFKTIAYKDLGGRCVWRKQIIQRKFSYMEDYEQSHFHIFLKNICGNNQNKMMAFFSAIGYLIHNYNHPSKGQAVICYDEQITNLNAPQGGTGKGIFAQAIKAIRDTVKIDGKNFKEENRFAFQDVSLSTQVVWLDDAKPQLGIDRFNSILTDGWNIEQKFRPSIYISAEESPKMLICSNSILEGEGSTRKRRQFILEFSDFYSGKIKTGIEEPVKEEHGCTFFSTDWNEQEWSLFDSLIVYCVKLYMQKGLIPYPVQNVVNNRIRQVLGDEFFDWVTDQAFSLNKEYLTKPLFVKYKDLYHQEDDRFKQRLFTNKLKRYAEIKSWKMKCRSSHGVSSFHFLDGS